MTATPNTMVQQMAAARVANVRFNGNRLAYTTTTGDVRVIVPETIETWDEYCFVCSRPTDHMGEHGENEVSEYREDVSLSEDGAIRWVTHVIRVHSA